MGAAEAATTMMAITQTEVARARGTGTSDGTETIITKRCRLRSDRSVAQNVETIALIRGLKAHKILEETTSGKTTDRKSDETTVASEKTVGMTVRDETALKTISKATRKESHRKLQLS